MNFPLVVTLDVTGAVHLDLRERVTPDAKICFAIHDKFAKGNEKSEGR